MWVVVAFGLWLGLGLVLGLIMVLGGKGGGWGGVTLGDSGIGLRASTGGLGRSLLGRETGGYVDTGMWWGLSLGLWLIAGNVVVGSLEFRILWRWRVWLIAVWVATDGMATTKNHKKKHPTQAPQLPSDLPNDGRINYYS